MCAVPIFQREMVLGDLPTAQGMEILVKHGAEIRSYDRQNSTTLALAVRAGNTDYAEFILKYVGFVTVSGEFDLALFTRQDKEFLNKASAESETALSNAIRTGNTKIVKWLLELDVDVEWPSSPNQDQTISALLIAYQSMRL
jgi:ankyrin repeat protein